MPRDDDASASNASATPLRFGVATSAYQIEGGQDLDGRGTCVWDMFCRQPGRVAVGSNGAVACEHRAHPQRDVDLIASLGAQMYRFSIAWPRVLPDGIGAPSERGLDFYDALVDRLLEAQIEPWVTLFHWDYPLALFHRGGWLNRDSASWFAEYTELVARRIGDRVKHWITLNEPQCFIGLGHQLGRHAPGLRLGDLEVLRATHHALLAHGDAVRVLRDHSPGARVGWSPALWVTYPDDESEESIAAARARSFAVDFALPSWTFNNAWYNDAVVLRRYPDVGPAPSMFGVLDGDMERMSPAIDFIGMNYYHAEPLSLPVRGRDRGHAETMMGWAVDPCGLYWAIRFFHERYDRPMAITENGLANMDWVARDGGVHDHQRIDYIDRHLAELTRAATQFPVEGYFHWSLLDNFEWELGYSRRFGLVHVDYESQRRTPKDSFTHYRARIAELLNE